MHSRRVCVSSCRLNGNSQEQLGEPSQCTETEKACWATRRAGCIKKLMRKERPDCQREAMALSHHWWPGHAIARLICYCTAFDVASSILALAVCMIHETCCYSNQVLHKPLSSRQYMHITKYYGMVGNVHTIVFASSSWSWYLHVFQKYKHGKALTHSGSPYDVQTFP